MMSALQCFNDGYYIIFQAEINIWELEGKHWVCDVRASTDEREVSRQHFDAGRKPLVNHSTV